MSHPNPSQENSYPEDGVTHYPKAKKKIKKMASKVRQAKKSGYKSVKDMDKARSKPNYMPGPGSPKY